MLKLRDKYNKMLIKKKVLLLTSVFNFIIVFVYSYISYFDQKELLYKSYDEKLETGAYAVYNAFGDEFHEKISNGGSISESEHLNNIKKLNILTEKLGFAYAYSMVLVNDKVCFATSSATKEELDEGSFSPFLQTYDEVSDSVVLSFKDKKLRYEEATDRWGTFRSIIMPFVTKSGKIYIIGLDISISEINSILLKVLMNSFLIGLALLIFSLILFYKVISKISKPINQLVDAARNISDGNLDFEISINSQDETKVLADAFQGMVSNLRNSISRLEEEKATVEGKIKEAVQKSEYEKKYLASSVENILETMNRFSQGDLTVRLEKGNDDIIGKISDGFNDAIKNISMIINDVQIAVDLTTNSWNQIARSAEEMAAGSTEQADEISEIAKAVEEITSSISDNTLNATKVTSLAKAAGEKAKDSGKIIMETISGMNKISDVVIKSAEVVNELGKSSTQIGEIAEIIADIADQTNLLALNAAIEAARAGEQGRGFAVVADEVRKLAERTTNATKEIDKMIKQIQQNSSGVLKIIEKGTKEIESGKVLSGSAGSAINEIITESEKVSDFIGQIAAAGEQQSVTSREINKNLESITIVTQQSAANSKSIVNASEDLKQLTIELKNKIERFTTSDMINNLQ